MNNVMQRTPADSCSSVNAKSILNALEHKIFYFQINTAELILVTVLANRTVSFTRIDQMVTNNDLEGEFRDVATGEIVMISPDTIYAC